MSEEDSVDIETKRLNYEISLLSPDDKARYFEVLTQKREELNEKMKKEGKPGLGNISISDRFEIIDAVKIDPNVGKPITTPEMDEASSSKKNKDDEEGYGVTAPWRWTDYDPKED